MLPLCQKIITIQGEGSTVGTPVLLLRVAGCNIQCDFCDTKYSWNTNNVEKIEDLRRFSDYIKQVLQNHSLSTILFTGGEPLLYWQQLVELLRYLDDDKLTVEVETNGSLIDAQVITAFERVKPWIILHVSPKITEKYTLDHYKHVFNLLQYSSLTYDVKLIHFSDKDVLELVDNLNIPKHLVYVLPFTPPRDAFDTYEAFLDKFRKSCVAAARFCLYTGFKYSPREHIFLFDPKDANEFNIVM